MLSHDRIPIGHKIISDRTLNTGSCFFTFKNVLPINGPYYKITYTENGFQVSYEDPLPDSF